MTEAAVTDETRFTVPMREWGGDAKRTLIQGLLIHETSGTRIVHQADDVPGQSQQDIVFRAHDADNDYLGAVTVKRAGHGSTVGLESMGDDRMRLWFGHDQARTSGWVEYTVGQRGTVVFHPAVLPEGDISIDQGGNLLCLRNGNRYRGYDFSSVKAGQRQKLWDFTIPAWGERFQGHLVAGDRLYVHRDVHTRGASRADEFDFAGKQTGSLDTTRMGDEAEGFCVAADGWVWVVKRTGDTGPDRIVVATRWTRVRPKGDDMDWIIWRGVRINPGSVPSLDALAAVTGPDIRVTPTQGGYNRGGVSASAGTHDRGAAMDLSVRGLSASLIGDLVRLARECGWFASHRRYIRGLWPAHVHMVRVGDRTASAAAQAQVEDYRRGRDGLAGHGRDLGPTVYGRNGETFPTWAQSRRNPAVRLKTVADWVRELGPVKDVSVIAINRARRIGYCSRYVAVMQRWLNLAAKPAPRLAEDGLWGPGGPTQAALDGFRRSLGWTDADARGEVGSHSLSRLRAAVDDGFPLPIRDE